MTVPIFVPAGELVRLTCRKRPTRSKRHWKYIEGGGDIERPAVMLNGKVQDGTRRLFAAAQNQPTMLVPVVEHRSFAEMQLRIRGIKYPTRLQCISRACRTHGREIEKKAFHWVDSAEIMRQSLLHLTTMKATIYVPIDNAAINNLHTKLPNGVTLLGFFADTVKHLTMATNVTIAHHDLGQNENEKLHGTFSEALSQRPVVLRSVTTPKGMVFPDNCKGPPHLLQASYAALVDHEAGKSNPIAIVLKPNTVFQNPPFLCDVIARMTLGGGKLDKHASYLSAEKLSCGSDWLWFTNEKGRPVHMDTPSSASGKQCWSGTDHFLITSTARLLSNQLSGAKLVPSESALTINDDGDLQQADIRISMFTKRNAVETTSPTGSPESSEPPVSLEDRLARAASSASQTPTGDAGKSPQESPF